MKIEASIENSDKLTGIFGRWPSFHHAEILDMSLWRGAVDPENGRYIFPVFTITVHLWEMTEEVDDKGFFVLRHHTLASLRFHDVHDLRLEGFNHQNAIFELSIERRERPEQPSPYFVVEMEPSFGVAATFTCLRVEVRNATPCNADGKAI